MRTLTTDPSYTLIELTDLEKSDLPASVRRHREVLTRLVEWARSFLWNPNPQLGREGAVCPFVQMSMEKGFFFLSVVDGSDVDQETARNRILRYRDWFLEMEPRSAPWAQFKTILILFPDLTDDDAPRVIDTVQESLKHDFVAEGLMIGQFHSKSNEPGLWSSEFRPLRSPVPLLGIRHMVPTDLPFLKNDPRMVLSYLERFGHDVPTRLRGMVTEVAAELGIDLDRYSAPVGVSRGGSLSEGG